MRYFLAVAREENMTRAAEQLHVTQPTLSKQLKERMSEDEQKKSEQEKAFADMKEELENLKREKELSDLTASYISMGYDKDLAADTAKARLDGDKAKEFANGEKHRQALEKRIKEQLMDNTPKPAGTGDDGKPETDLAVEKAKELAKAKFGGSSYSDIMDKYR